MKLLIIFDRNIDISPEKVCVHVGHSTREIAMTTPNHFTYKKWKNNYFKTVILKDKINENLKNKILSEKHKYIIYDAGLDGVFQKNTILGYAILIPNDDCDYKRLRTLKF